MRRCLVVSCSAIAVPPRVRIHCRLMNRTLAAPMDRSKHQFDVGEEVDSEQVFGRDGSMMEQVPPAVGGAPPADPGRGETGPGRTGLGGAVRGAVRGEI